MKADMVLTPEPRLERADALRRARAELRPQGDWFRRPTEAEGGCGVTGFACTLPVGGRHIYEPSILMRNRGNGKGGGIAACGLVASEHGVSPEVLQRDYILQIALLDPEARGEVEKAFVEPYFDIDQGGLVPTLDDYRDVPLLEARPPDVARYFVHVKPEVVDRFAAEKDLFSANLSQREVADEFVYHFGGGEQFVLVAPDHIFQHLGQFATFYQIGFAPGAEFVVEQFSKQFQGQVLMLHPPDFS